MDVHTMSSVDGEDFHTNVFAFGHALDDQLPSVRCVLEQIGTELCANESKPIFSLFIKTMTVCKRHDLTASIADLALLRYFDQVCVSYIHFVTSTVVPCPGKESILNSSISRLEPLNPRPSPFFEV